MPNWRLCAILLGGGSYCLLQVKYQNLVLSCTSESRYGIYTIVIELAKSAQYTVLTAVLVLVWSRRLGSVTNMMKSSEIDGE